MKNFCEKVKKKYYGAERVAEDKLTVQRISHVNASEDPTNPRYGVCSFFGIMEIVMEYSSPEFTEIYIKDVFKDEFAICAYRPSNFKVSVHLVGAEHHQAMVLSVDASGVLSINPYNGSTSPKYTYDLRAATSYVEDIHEMLTHISPEMFSRINSRVTLEMPNIANNTTTRFNLPLYLNYILEEIQKEIECETGRHSGGSKEAPPEVRRKKKAVPKRAARKSKRVDAKQRNRKK